MFRRPYFNYGDQPYSVTRDHTHWEYSGNLGDDNAAEFSYRMYFAGREAVDSHLYKVLWTKNGKETWFDSATSVFQTSDIENGLKFLMREEDGKVYVHASLGSVEEGYSPWNIEEREALLYDFKAEVGDEMEVMGSSGNLLNGVVTSTFTVNIDNLDCRGYTILFEELNREFTVIEWLGNITAGCLPYFLDDVSDEAIDGSLTYLPLNNRMQSLDKITYSDGDIICEKDVNGLWPWEKTEGVAAVETAFRLSFDGKAISAESEYMTIYTLSGNAVAKGFGEVSTESLQPGVYVAKAGSQTLKILVK